MPRAAASGCWTSRAMAPPSTTIRGRRETPPVTATPRGRPRRNGGDRDGRSLTAQPTSTATAIPGGRLIKNSQCHEKRSVTNPPTTGPRVGASIANNPAINVARVRVRQSNIRKIAEKTSGIRAPPQNPWTIRAGIRLQNPVETAQAKLAGGEADDADDKRARSRQHQGQPAGQRYRDDFRHQIGGLYPAEPTERDAEPGLDLRQ